MKEYSEPTIYYLCNDAERALGLEVALKNYHIVCIDDNPIIDYIKNAGGKVFCLERELNERNPIFRNSNRLLQHEKVRRYIEDNTPKGSVPNIIVFKVASNIERSCQKYGYNLLNTSAELNRKFETKISQYNELKDAKVQFPPTVIGNLGDLNYADLTNKLGNEFVVQYDRGHTGTGTIFIDNKEEFQEQAEKFPDRKSRISQKINGKYWTLNACVTKYGIAFSGLSYQITGVPECTTQKGGTVGNDWTFSKPLQKKVTNQMTDITTNAGKIMQKYGYKGLFGLDFVVDESNTVYLIEINARQPASTGMHTKLMLSHGQIPLIAFHLAEFLFKEEDTYKKFISQFQDISITNFSEIIKEQDMHAYDKIEASQLFLRNTSESAINVTNTKTPGIYKYENSTLQWLSEGYSILDTENQVNQANSGTFQILAVSENHKVSPGAEVARIQAPFSLLGQDGYPEKWVIEVVNKLNENR